MLLFGVLFANERVHEQIWLGSIALGPWTLHPLSLVYVVSGSAMVSGTLRIPKP